MLCSPCTDFNEASVDRLQDLYDDTMSALLDKHAPKRVVRRRHQPSMPWFDSECAATKCRARAFERRYSRTRTSADRYAWIAEVCRKHRLCSSKQNLYWEAKVVESRSNPMKLWKNLSETTQREKPRAPAADGLSAQCFSDAFADKINRVRSATAGSPEPSSQQTAFNAQFNAFKPSTQPLFDVLLHGHRPRTVSWIQSRRGL